MCSLIAGVVLGTLVAAQSRQAYPGPMPNLPFSAAVKADGLIYVAGTLVTEGDIRAQTRATIEQISGVLQKSGSSLANVASVNVYRRRPRTLPP
jgi:enamine deaminase RidA (YjgF/YER057c/UK114 family)